MNRSSTGVIRTVALVLCLASVPANAADQILTPRGLGSVKIGMTVAQAEKALGAKLKPLDKTDGVSVESCWETHRTDNPDPAVSYMVWYGKIVRIAIDRYDKEENWETVPPFATDKGIRIGSADAHVREAYGKSLSVRPHPEANDENDDTMVVMTVLTNRRSGIAFETGSKKVSTFRAGLAKAIRMTEGCFKDW
jgi:hypothetical protein